MGSDTGECPESLNLFRGVPGESKFVPGSARRV